MIVWIVNNWKPVLTGDACGLLWKQLLKISGFTLHLLLQPNVVKQPVPNYWPGKADCSEILTISSALDISPLSTLKGGTIQSCSLCQKKECTSICVCSSMKKKWQT